MEVLTLPQSMIMVSSEVLVKRIADGKVISEISLQTVRDVAIRNEPDWSGVAIAAFLFLVALICKAFIPIVWLSWISSIVIFIFGALIVVGGVARPVLWLSTKDGDVSLEIKDPKTDAQAFAVALKQRMRAMPQK